MPYDKTKTATLADALALLEVHSDLTDTQRRDQVSAIKRIATHLNLPPADLPTDAPSLRKLLATLHPAQIGVSAKSLSNVKTALTKALQSSGYLPPFDPKGQQTAAWQAFHSSCEAKHQVFALARFVNYCNHRNIEPNDVTDEVMSAFHDYLDERLLGKEPAKLCKETVQTWNGIVSRQGLPLAKLSYQKSGQYCSRPLTSYPQSLQDDFACYRDRLAHVDLFADDGPDKPLRPTSLRNIDAHLRQYLDGLVQAGGDSLSFNSLADVVTAEHMKRAFKAIMVRRGLDTPHNGGLHNIAATLIAIARHHLCLPEKELDAILKIKRMAKPDNNGMSEKNRARLGQFNDWQNVARLTDLPETLMNRALANPASRMSALLAMYAVAIAILLSCPMRAKNLAQLDLDSNVLGHRNGTHTSYTIRVEAEDVKNLEHIEVVLNPRNSKLLHTYMMRFRHRLTEANGFALFPMKSKSAPRDPGNFGSDIKAAIYRETGLTMHMHLFRHFAAFLYLQERPGDFETVRRLLKHKQLQTTVDFYASLSNQWAHDHYDQVVLSKWDGRHV